MGRTFSEFPLTYLRRQIGIVQQEPFLFNGTVRDNILYGDLDCDPGARGGGGRGGEGPRVHRRACLKDMIPGSVNVA